MKIYFRYCCLLVVAIIAIGCSKKSGTHEPPPNPPTPPPTTTEKMTIRVSASLSGSNTTDFRFEKGDCIGVFVVNYSEGMAGTLTNSSNYVNNMRFSYNGTWTPDSETTWKDDETHADFYAYYPYTKLQSVSAYEFSVKENQSTETEYKASDLLIGNKKNVAPSNSVVEIPMSPVMSKVNIYLEAGNGFTAESLAAAEVSVKINNVKCKANVDIATGEVKPTGISTTLKPLLTDNHYKAIIVPQTVESGELITVTVNGKEYSVDQDYTFEANKTHKFTITISNESDGVNVDLKPWIDDDTDHGGNAE